MKPASILFASFLFASAAAFSQSTKSAPDSFGVACMEQIGPDGHFNGCPVPPASVNACPIALRAQHLSDGDLMKTGFAHPKGIGQALHLTLSGGDHGQIADANIRVHGFTPKGRLSQAAPANKADAVRTLHLHLRPGADQNSVAEFWVPGLSAVTSVEIASAKYADGSSFAPSGKMSCRVAPDLVMLVHP